MAGLPTYQPSYLIAYRLAVLTSGPSELLRLEQRATLVLFVIPASDASYSLQATERCLRILMLG